MGSCSSKKSKVISQEHRLSTLFDEKPLFSLGELDQYYSDIHYLVVPKVRTLYQEVLSNRAEGVQELSLQFTPLGGGQAVALARVLAFYPDLRILRLWKARLGDVGMKAVAEVLPRLEVLECLGVEDNNLTDESMSSLSLGLQSLHHLRDLYLQINSLTDKGLTSLLPGLSSKHTLTTLNLSENLLTSVCLTPLLAVCGASLKHLDLAQNRLGEEGGFILITLLPGLEHLEKVRIGGNGLGDEAEMKLIKAAGRVQVLV